MIILPHYIAWQFLLFRQKSFNVPGPPVVAEPHHVRAQGAGGHPYSLLEQRGPQKEPVISS